MAATDAPTREIGRLGDGSQHNAWTMDVLEHVPDLQYPLSVKTYARMRHDPTLRSILAAYALPILRASWHVEARGASEGITRVVADSLGLPVLGDTAAGADEAAITTRAVRWTDHLRLALGSLTFGHMGFEPVYTLDGGTAYLAGLPERLPYALTSIEVDDRGDLTGVKQARAQGKDVLIPADRLLWYVHDREGAAWHGTSMLRPCFGSWLFKQDGLRGQATTLRRFGSGVPVAEPLPGTNPTPAQIAEAQRMVSSIRVGDGAGAVPVGFTLRIKGVEGTVPDHMPFLRYLDEQMARAALTSVMDLGSTTNGSRALGEVFVDLLSDALQAVAEEIAVTASQIARRLTDFNEGDAASAPVIRVGDVGSSRQVLAQTVSGLVQAGALSMDDALEAWVRDSFDLPARSAPRPTPPTVGQLPAPVAPTADEAPAPAPALVPVAAANRAAGTVAVSTSWPYRRQPTAVEAKSGMDPVALDVSAATLLADVLGQWPGIAAAHRAELEDAVRAAVDSGDLTRLADLTVDPSAAVPVLLAALEAAYSVGADSAAAEAAAQGVQAPDVQADAAQLAAVATVTAGLMARGLASAAGREALRRAGAGATGTEVAGAVRAHLESLSLTFVRDQVGGLIADGMNTGRADVFAAGPPATFYGSEVRDGNTCPRCVEVDGARFDSLDAARAAYATGGYVDCDGGLRCRGVILAVYDEAAA